ncbi:hypothetical protein [Paludibacterium sp. B53371]|uniref:hypothetical protein n=1 Tax=Paludibacterium sp. B53371 TaxID=2806263 RepID=UPI001C05DB03|nr:hypothetical protein [Paludibacterium sp. B53371]
MVVVLLAWLYVIVIFAVAQTTMVATVSVLFFLGVLPVLGMGWVLRRRRRMRLARLEKRVKA